MTIGDYFKVFVLILVLGLVCACLWLWKDKDNAQANLLAAQTLHSADVSQHNGDVAQHKTDLATIQRVTDYRDANAHLMADFIAKMAGIDRNFNGLNNSIANLRRTNADVEKYLSTPIPPALLCLIDSGLCSQPAAPAAATTH